MPRALPRAFRLAFLLGVFLASMLVAGPAGAHTTAFTEAKLAQAGDTFILLDFAPSPFYAGDAPQLDVRLSAKADNGGVLNATPVMTLFAPSGANATLPLPQRGDPGQYKANHRFTEAGRWNVTLSFTNVSGHRVEAPMNFTVYRNLPFRFTPADASADYETNKTYRMAWHVFRPTDGQLYDALRDLEMRVEHWDDQHVTRFNTRYVDGSRADTGLWEFPLVFPSKGMYHLQFASVSGGFGHEDAPMQHVYAVEAFVDATPPAPLETERGRSGISLVVGGVAALGLIVYFAVRSARG